MNVSGFFFLRKRISEFRSLVANPPGNYIRQGKCATATKTLTPSKIEWGPYQRTPKEVARGLGYSGLGVHSVGPVGDFLD